MNQTSAQSSAAPQRPPLDRRALWVCGLAITTAIAVGFVALALIHLIAFVTNLAFHGRVSFVEGAPLGHSLGGLVVLVPVVGGVLVGLMARFGSKAIRGHGIPEAMEQVLYNDSRIPARMAVLKPLSSAIAIGTGGPFGAEGPIIATGSAIGSFVGQIVKVTADERKTLLAAGAAAGMAATFGSPVSAVLLAIELLLFEYRARSVIPVALAATAATAVRMAWLGVAPVFPLPEMITPGALALSCYIALGAATGLLSVGITRAVYAVEDRFERLPIHWMWWPAIGGLVVGVMGYVQPRSLGVGYANISETLAGSLEGQALLALVAAKFVSWVFALGSGTSGGTLAPLLTFGAAFGALTTQLLTVVFPHHALDPRVGALVGMAAMFVGASRALLASVVFAFECTRQPLGLLPLLGGGAAAYLVSCMCMPNSIMTEKLARRGSRVSSDYRTDFLDGQSIGAMLGRPIVTFPFDLEVRVARERAAASGHQGYPVVAADGALVGVVTQRDLAQADPARTLGEVATRDPIVVHPDESLRDAADRMVDADVGRVLVVPRSGVRAVLGIVTRSDVLRTHRRRLHSEKQRVVLRKALRPWQKLVTKSGEEHDAPSVTR